jgi:hypothetical protein
MKKEAPRRIYNFTDARLIGIVELLEAFVSRDADEFKRFGYTASAASDLLTQTQAFLNTPNDTNLIQWQASTTQEKDTKAIALKSAIREITNRARLVYGEDTPRFRRFGTKGMDAMTDDQLRTCGEQVEDVARECLPDLSTRGVTSALIDSLQDATEAFATSLKAQRKAISDRSIFTDERVQIANALYSRTVELSKAGKAIWYEKNEAKYRDYIIYDEKGTPVEKTEPVREEK